MSEPRIPISRIPIATGDRYRDLRAGVRKSYKPRPPREPKPTPENGLPPRSKTLFARIKEILRANHGARQEAVANAFVTQMEKGSFIHAKELIDREEGKVPNRIANADGTNIKTYVGVPTDDELGAP